MKNKILKTMILPFVVVLLFQNQSFAQGVDSTKLFTRSVIYGTLAGTLVGFATLAFTSNPGGNLNNVARGASYGLYAGILLGAYVAYGVSDEPAEGEQGPSLYEGGVPGQDPFIDDGLSLPPGSSRTREIPQVSLAPVLPTGPQNSGWGGLVSVLARF